MSNLGMELSKTLFRCEPKLLASDIEASAKAAAEVSSLLGCILATVLAKQPENYEPALRAVFEKIHEFAVRVANKVEHIAANSEPTIPS